MNEWLNEWQLRNWSVTLNPSPLCGTLAFRRVDKINYGTDRRYAKTRVGAQTDVHYIVRGRSDTARLDIGRSRRMDGRTGSWELTQRQGERRDWLSHEIDRMFGTFRHLLNNLINASPEDALRRRR